MRPSYVENMSTMAVN